MISVNLPSSSFDQPKGPTLGLGWYGDVMMVFCGPPLLLTMLGGARNSGGGGKLGGIMRMLPGGGEVRAPLSSE